MSAFPIFPKFVGLDYMSPEDSVWLHSNPTTTVDDVEGELEAMERDLFADLKRTRTAAQVPIGVKAEPPVAKKAPEPEPDDSASQIPEDEEEPPQSGDESEDSISASNPNPYLYRPSSPYQNAVDEQLIVDMVSGSGDEPVVDNGVDGMGDTDGSYMSAVDGDGDFNSSVMMQHDGGDDEMDEEEERFSQLTVDNPSDYFTQTPSPDDLELE